MRDVRIFVSSPGDVAREREMAQTVIARVQGEFSAHVQLLPYFWEYEPMLANAGDYQENIPAPGDFEIFVCLLWSRLGTRLNSRHRTKDGREFDSGTAFEFQNALEAARSSRTPEQPHGTPDMLVFIKTANFDPPHAPPLTRAERDERIRQFDALQDFINDAFRDHDEGTFNIAANSFPDLSTFERLLEKGLRRCLRARLPDDATIEAAPVATWTRGSPYFGLRPFGFEDAPVFFGRTGAIDAVLTRLRSNAEAGCAFCLLFGSSGVGKSSLARAGVLPLLVRPGVMEGVGLWRRAVFQPRDGAACGDLFLALTDALLREEALRELTADGTRPDALAAMLRAEPGSIAALLKGGLSQAAVECARERKLDRQPAARLALLVDQLEELFTQDWITDADRAAFIHALAVLARSGLVFVVATLRADFFSRCESLPELMALKDEHGHYHVEPAKDFELGQMIRLPALAAGLRFERDAATGESLDERLRTDALRSPEALPLLAFALERLWIARDVAEHRLTFAAYAALGGMEGALRTQAEAMHAAWAQAHGAAAVAAFDAVLRRLVTVRDGGSAEPHYARAWVEKNDFTVGSAEADFVERAIAARLFVADEPTPRRAVVTLAHEALLRAWPRLTAWIEENRAFFRELARLQARLAEWLASGRRDDLLLPAGLAFERARALTAGHSRDLTPEQRVYVQASAARLQRLTRRKVLAVAAAFALLAAVAAVAVGQALRAQYQRAAAEAARGDADDLNLFLLGDLRERLEEAGRLDLLDAAAEKAGAYLAKLNTLPGKPADARIEPAEIMRLQFAQNLARLRLGQGRLGEALAALDALEQSGPVPASPSPELRRVRAGLLNARCDILARTVEIAAGQAAGRAALDLLAPLFDPPSVLLGADVLINLADLAKQARQHSEAREQIEQAIQRCEPLAQTSEGRAARRTLLRALLRECDLAQARGDLIAAKSSGERRLALAEAYDREEPLAPLWKVERAFSHDRLATVFQRLEQLDLAAQQATLALTLWSERLAHDPDNREWLRLEATAHTRMGQILRDTGDARGAWAQFDEARRIDEGLVAAAPKNLSWSAGLATALSLLGDATAALRDRRGTAAPAEAPPLPALDPQPHYARALEIRRQLHTDPVGRMNVENTRNLIVSLTKNAASAMNGAAAQKLAEEAVALARDLGGAVAALPDHRALLPGALETLGETEVGQGHQPEGRLRYAEARALRLALVAQFPDDPEFTCALAECRLQLGGLYQDGTHVRPAMPDLPTARVEYAAAHQLLQTLVRNFPQNVRYKHSLADAESALARLAPEGGEQKAPP